SVGQSLRYNGGKSMVPASDPDSAEALRRYELLANCSRDIILYIRRSDGRILEANRAAVEAYGYSRPELLALTIYDLRQLDTQPAVPPQMAEADGGGVLFEPVHRRKDGSTFPVEVSSQAGGEGNNRVLISVIRDISARQEAQAALEASEERL